MTFKLNPVDDTDTYLSSCKVVNWQHPSILVQAEILSHQAGSKQDLVKRSFEFVRDTIHHSMDSQQDGYSCIASDVLANGHGFCYAKSHLLTALLRANNIPAGLCYQRLTLADFPEEDEQLTYCLHGLVAVLMPEIKELNTSSGWYRIDPRGNKKGVNAQFNPPTEQLAFAIKSVGEKDFSEILAKPLACVVNVLNSYDKHQDICAHLPDKTSL